MALHRNVTLDEVEVPCYFPEITTAAGGVVAYTVSPIKGEIIQLKATQYASTAGTDTVITVAVNTTNITGGTITIPASAAGTVTSTLIDNPGITALVNENDVIRFTSNFAANDSTVPATCSAIIRNRRN